ncbi:hypothetical protein PsorP6_005643 [Peronosclerospora sorghi]|uniref:Uncharacterized protein n=1 Tax=Peronosclerospora sorghi TaxID=230839 RepID=A0ACC0W3X0_9STRA|nr:hypothetical protein PsorP6_005643 [Peronosclerospora sorghi]
MTTAHLVPAYGQTERQNLVDQDELRCVMNLWKEEKISMDKHGKNLLKAQATQKNIITSQKPRILEEYLSKPPPKICKIKERSLQQENNGSFEFIKIINSNVAKLKFHE